MNTQLKMKTTKVGYAFSTVCQLLNNNNKQFQNWTEEKRHDKNGNIRPLQKRKGHRLASFQHIDCSKSPIFPHDRQDRALCVSGGHFGFKCTERGGRGWRREARKIDTVRRFHTHPQAMLGTYRKWSITHPDAYFIFPLIGAKVIQERRLFQLRVNHWGEYRKN